MKIEFEWDVIDCAGTRRAKVFGGWVLHTYNSAQGSCEWSISETMVFVPDPKHEWEIEE